MNDHKRTILITGASSGIGHHVAQRFLEIPGWTVVATARRIEDILDLAERGATARCLDLSDEGSIAALADEVKAGQRLDVLFNNAGYGSYGAVEDLSRGQMDHQFQVNVFGPMDLTNRLLSHLSQAENGGRIIFNSSVLSYAVSPMKGNYCAAKAALDAYAKTLRMEHAHRNISVTLIHPGPIESRFNVNAYEVYLKEMKPRRNSELSPQYAALERALRGLEDNMKAFRLPPETVFRAVYRAATDRRPKECYRITLPSKVLYWFQRALSDRWVNGAQGRRFAQEGDGP